MLFMMTASKHSQDMNFVNVQQTNVLYQYRNTREFDPDSAWKRSS